MKFQYKGRSGAGSVVTGVVEANDRADALSHLHDSGITPLAVNEKKGFALKGGSIDIQLFKKVKLSEKIIFTKNLAGMLKAGLPLTRGLEVLSKQSTNKYFKSRISDLIATIDKGSTFSEGLAKFPTVYSPLFVSMVKAGEESGSLPGSLLEVGINLEKSYNLNRKIKSAMMYPMIILCAIFLIGILMFIFVVPTLTKTFGELGVTLPLSTRIVVGISNLLSNHILIVILAILAMIFGVYMLFKLPRTKRGIDYISLRIPVVGTLIKEVNTARTTRTMSSLLTSGVSIGRAITITKEVLQNVYYKKILTEVEEAIQRGEPMSQVFKAHANLYPVMVGEMMEVGEETGKSADMLLDIATFYETEVDAKTKDLSTIIEPVLMIFIGAAVGFFAISMLSPMYSVMDAIK